MDDRRASYRTVRLKT